MPRCLWIEFPGAIYLVMSRGGRRAAIYHDVHLNPVRAGLLGADERLLRQATAAGKRRSQGAQNSRGRIETPPMDGG